MQNINNCLVFVLIASYIRNIFIGDSWKVYKKQLFCRHATAMDFDNSRETISSNILHLINFIVVIGVKPRALWSKICIL